MDYCKANFSRLLLMMRRSRRSERRILLKFFIREQSTPHLSVNIAITRVHLAGYQFIYLFKTLCVYM